jgi:putative DNA methylase
MPTKLIEVALPLDVINKEAAREKSIRHGHPSTLHLWWARRPLAACRAVLFAQLVDDPSAHPDRFPTPEAQDAERQRLFRIIERLVPWGASNDEAVLEDARAEIRKCYPDGLPAIADPFCGGGSIPLEAQRLGLAVEASDLNPVAVLITKGLTELPARFVEQPPVHPADNGTLVPIGAWRGSTGLAEDVRYYGTWMRERAQERIGHLYPKVALADGTNANPVAWLWARTVRCPNPACAATMPLARTFWLSKRRGNEAWLRPIVDHQQKHVRFEIGHGQQGPIVDGTKTGRGANFKCLCCGSPANEDYVHSEIDEHRSGAQLMATVAEGKRQRLYLAPDSDQETAADVIAPDNAPDQPARGTFGGNAQGRRYGFGVFADYFTNRQLNALCTFSDLVSEARAQVVEDSGGDERYADAVATYLAFVVSKTADRASSLCAWEPNKDRLRGTFQRQAISMSWDFAEGNMFGGAGGDFGTCLISLWEVLERLRPISSATTTQADAADISRPDSVLTTDPPYYDNIGYADLSDFFYVWLRRSLRRVYPELLGTLLTPKSDELIASPYRFGGSRALADKHFEAGFSRVFAKAAVEQASGTPLILFYAFKQSESDDNESSVSVVASTGWEKMLEGLLGAGLSVTGTWPMRTELGNRMLSSGTNALASSIVLVCRSRPHSAGITDRRGFQQALRAGLSEALRNLQSGGVAPVDLAQAAIGPGMAVFSSYAKVVEPNGTAMSVRTALSLINQVLDEVTAEQEGEFDEDTRWAIAWYAEHGVEDGPFGRADDLSRAKNVSVEGLVRAGIVKSKAGKVRLLDRSELDPLWDPAKDSRLTIWEITQQLIRRLMDESEASAAELLARVGGLGEPARDLAYRLFLIAESKKWAREAGPYNALAAAWPELSRRAAAGRSVQETLI